MPKSIRVRLGRSLAGLALFATLASGQDAAVVRRLQERFITPCCWSESVAVHRSETAAEMRAEIERMVRQGQTEDQIVAHFVAQHGERILMEPRGLKQTWLTVMPFIALALGLAALVWFLRRRSAPVPKPAVAGPAPVSDEDLDW